MDDLSRRLEEQRREHEEERRSPERLRETLDRQSTLIEVHSEQLKGTLDEIQELKTEIRRLDARIKTRRQEEKIWYILPLIAVIVFVGILVYKGWAEKPAVSIDFNVGEIIGGSLLGLGALIAGLTYAYRRTVRRDE